MAAWPSTSAKGGPENADSSDRGVLWTPNRPSTRQAHRSGMGAGCPKAGTPVPRRCCGVKKPNQSGSASLQRLGAESQSRCRVVHPPERGLVACPPDGHRTAGSRGSWLVPSESSPGMEPACPSGYIPACRTAAKRRHILTPENKKACQAARCMLCLPPLRIRNEVRVVLGSREPCLAQTLLRAE